MTGFSTPLFGVSWNPPTVDRDVARRVLAFLEDRRVLYSPSEVEMPEHCIESVLEIRRRLTDIIGHGGIADELTTALRAMRSACRQFLAEAHLEVDEDTGLLDRWGQRYRGSGHGLDDYLLNQALGRLRGVFGIQVGQLALAYGIDLEDGMASILPAPAG
jgi:hypothetical protein